MFVAPVAAVLLLRRRPAIARPLLLLSMIGSFAYGALSHYVLASPDNVSSVAAQGWGLVFHGTTAALAVAEGAGILLGVVLVSQKSNRGTGPTAPA